MNVHCIVKVDEKVVEIYCGVKLMGWVREDVSGEPLISLFGDIDSIVKMSFNDIDIIRDNWNHLQGSLEKTSDDIVWGY